jgi:hypothetical protein
MCCKKTTEQVSVDRTISKQEAMCLLGTLPLTLCSEKIEYVAFSPFRRVVNPKEDDQDNTTTKTDWVLKYESRQGELATSFHHYVTTEMNLKKGRMLNILWCTGLHQFYTIMRLSTVRYLLLSGTIGIQTMVEIESIVQQTWEIIL